MEGNRRRANLRRGLIAWSARLLALAVLAPAIALNSAGRAQADCAAPPALADAVDQAASVFVGEATAAAFDSDEATLSVLWIWKGPDLPAELTVSTPLVATNGEAGFRFRQDSTFIVVVAERTSPIVIGECSGTRVYREDGELIPDELQEAAGRTVGRLPGEVARLDEPDLTGQARTRAVLLGILAAVGMILVVIMAARPDEDEPGKKKRLRGLFSRGKSGDRLLGRLRRRNR